MPSPTSRQNVRSPQQLTPDQVRTKVAFLARVSKQLSRAGNELESLKAKETSLLLQLFHGAAAEDLLEPAEELIGDMNAAGVRHFKRDTFDIALHLLTRAVQLTAGAEDPDIDLFACEEGVAARSRLRAATFNNLGCLEKRRGNYDAALAHLHMAVDAEQQMEEEGCAPSPATPMNMCAVLLKLGRVEEALVEAERAVRRVLAVRRDEPHRAAGGPTDDNHMLVVAYHNLAVTQERSDEPQTVRRAANTHAMAADVAAAELGPEHPTAKSVIAAAARFNTETAATALSSGTGLGLPALPPQSAVASAGSGMPSQPASTPPPVPLDPIPASAPSAALLGEAAWLL
eukprot:TRINITY_DN16075_c0_g1_i2.p1 TRINITY_DN16075_c0_g1~~TRINITY_DN16075_c0_g1_i2.p1  ORF type:complete len:362 (+),score=160.36 TRINITY_DN16075_c0_g1_i2:57-1088(+)